ncbi:MAG: hypothetical protein I8H66_01440 [Sphingobacteriia bacterium]|nr:hypothetical protein [Sphingobacteriia bacterium]
MAINKNHEFEELDGIKCGIVEKQVSPERLAFLKDLLGYNGFVVVAVSSPAPKDAPADPSLVPETYTVGVSDYTFNPINAIYGRLLKTRNGHVVTPAYWKQEETESHDEIPYYEHH